MPPASVDRALAYAEPGVRTAPPRTPLRVVGRWAWNLLRMVVVSVQAVLRGAGYVVLGAAVVTRAALVAVGRALLFVGRLRWDGRAVRVWLVRVSNRARIRTARLVLRRSSHVPLATPHESAGVRP